MVSLNYQEEFCVRNKTNLTNKVIKQHAYIPFKPVPHDDPMLCAQEGCGKPLDIHSFTGHCPLPDGSGYSFDKRFRRELKPTPAPTIIFEEDFEVVFDLEELCQ